MQAETQAQGFGAARGGGIAAPPITFDPGSTVVIEDNNVYINGDPVASAEQYADQATQFADRILDNWSFETATRPTSSGDRPVFGQKGNQASPT